mgnify:FL=1|tara:strand:- start:7237 stop:7935 length:699 start_codon:yes stop_codon:yes gene_type:complete
MNEKNTFRYERKFVIGANLLENIEDLESYLSISLNEAFDQRRINSIYYDTPNYKFANETAEGTLNRQKVRIRFYGDLDKFNFPQLEIKSKIGLVGKKEVIKLQKDELYENNFLIRNLHKLNIKNIEASFLLKAIEPKVTVTYKRKYFVSSCKKYRFTLDSNIGFKLFDRNFPNQSLNYDLIYPFNKKILELKYDVNDEVLVNRIVKNLPFRLTSFSKYLTALRNIGLINNFL